MLLLQHVSVVLAVLISFSSADVSVEPYSGNSHYSYGYRVHDPVTGDSKTQEETRDGDVVRGSYSLVEPDGSLRIVRYTADAVNGFNAVVEHETPSGSIAPPAQPIVTRAPVSFVTQAPIPAPISTAAPAVKIISPATPAVKIISSPAAPPQEFHPAYYQNTYPYPYQYHSPYYRNIYQPYQDQYFNPYLNFRYQSFPQYVNPSYQYFVR